MLDYSTFNKGRLRSACLAAGIDFDGKTVEQMRDLLSAHDAGQVVAEAAVTVPEAEVDAPVTSEPVSEPVHPDPEFAPVVPEVLAPVVQEVIPAVVVPAVIRTPRAESNGVKQPAPGTICRQIWDHCDSVYATGDMPQAKALRAWGAGRLDDTTMTVQFYRWRKFNGIVGRQA